MADMPLSFYDEVRFHLSLTQQNATTIVLASGRRYKVSKRDAVSVGATTVTIFVGVTKQIFFPLIDVSSLEVETELPRETTNA